MVGRFDVYTDKSACRWKLHHPKVLSKLARYLTFFSQFDFLMHHVEGVQNVVADALSRPVRYPDPSSQLSVHSCGHICFQQGTPSRRHFRVVTTFRQLNDAAVSMLLDDVDLRWEAHPIDVRQMHCKSIDELDRSGLQQ